MATCQWRNLVSSRLIRMKQFSHEDITKLRLQVLVLLHLCWRRPNTQNLSFVISSRWKFDPCKHSFFLWIQYLKSVQVVMFFVVVVFVFFTFYLRLYFRIWPSAQLVLPPEVEEIQSPHAFYVTSACSVFLHLQSIHWSTSLRY